MTKTTVADLDRLVYRVSLKDTEGFPTFVVAGPDRNKVWLYVHDLTPTVLRLHPPVVRFLQAALTELAAWFEQPVAERAPLVWTLPRMNEYPECVLVASHRRAWMHVFPRGRRWCGSIRRS